MDKTDFMASKYSLAKIFIQISQMLVMQGFDILLIKKDKITNTCGYCRNKKMALHLENENSVVVLGFICIGCGLL